MVIDIVPAGTGAIERTLDLRASRDRVWRAITDDAELSAWFGAKSTLDVRPGGAGLFEWPEHDMRFAARVEAVDAPNRLAWRWSRASDTPVDEGPSTLVEWTLEARPDGGTRLRLRETGFENPDSRRDNAGGWQHELGELVALVAGKPWEAGIRKAWTLRASPERVWAAFTDPALLAAWWTHDPSLVVRPGVDGWMDWPGEGGRFAIRFERIEPPTYVSWLWVTDAGVPIDEASQVLRTEWVIAPRDDGGTDLTLLETGFTTEHEYESNDSGWAEVVGGLLRELGEDGATAANESRPG